jgi:hypothetical protein
MSELFSDRCTYIDKPEVLKLEAENLALESERDYWKMTAKKLVGIRKERDNLREAAQAVVESERNERVEFEFYAPIEVCKAIEELKALLDGGEG